MAWYRNAAFIASRTDVVAAVRERHVAHAAGGLAVGKTRFSSRTASMNSTA